MCGNLSIYVARTVFIVKAGDLSLDTMLPQLLHVEQQDVMGLQEEVIPVWEKGVADSKSDSFTSMGPQNMPRLSVTGRKGLWHLVRQ